MSVLGLCKAGQERPGHVVSTGRGVDATSGCHGHHTCCWFVYLPCSRIEERNAGDVCSMNIWSRSPASQTMMDEGFLVLVLLLHFSLRQDGKSKTPSVYKFTTITQWINNLPGNTMDNVQQMKSNRLQTSGKDERWRPSLSSCIRNVRHKHWTWMCWCADDPGKAVPPRKSVIPLA